MKTFVGRHGNLGKNLATLARTSLGSSPGGVATVFQVGPRQFIGVPLTKPRDRTRHAIDTRRVSIANSLPQEIASPEALSRGRIAFNQEFRRLGTIPTVARPSDRPIGRSALSSWFPTFTARHVRGRTFIRCKQDVSGTTRQHANGSRLPCRDTARIRSWLPPRASPASNQATLPNSRISITHATKHGHREPPRPLKPFLH